MGQKLIMVKTDFLLLGRQKETIIFSFSWSELSNCATVTNSVVMWICIGFIFKYTTSESLMQVIISYPAIKLWVMPDKK